METKKTLISIIVPVYNTEKYIERCLDSIMKQDYPNFEVILVNDGSTDESGIIIQKYKEKYKNISYIKQENKGVGAARNAGIKVAKGDYISFVDSDDLIMEDYCSHLLVMQILLLRAEKNILIMFTISQKHLLRL